MRMTRLVSASVDAASMVEVVTQLAMVWILNWRRERAI